MYINEGGGKNLLDYFIEELNKKNQLYFILFDKRMPLYIIEKVGEKNRVIIEGSERNRKIVYNTMLNKCNRIFCFANVPPPVKTNLPTFILFHNILLLSNPFEKNKYSIKTKLIFFIKRGYIKLKNSKRYKWIVQTKNMKTNLLQRLGILNENIHIIPFYKNYFPDEPILCDRKKTSFIYIADGVSQKNHLNLFEAWIILSRKYFVKPFLGLTISDKFPQLLKKVKELKSQGLEIENFGVCNENEVKELYSKSEFLIYPSLAESFGLPLIEAATCGCKIIASDLNFVQDIVIPTDMFNPNSAEDIAEVIYRNISSFNIKQTSILIQSEIENLINLINS